MNSALPSEGKRPFSPATRLKHPAQSQSFAASPIQVRVLEALAACTNMCDRHILCLVGMLCHRNNLEIVRRHLNDEIAGLCCLAPPFNPVQNHNVFLKCL